MSNTVCVLVSELGGDCEKARIEIYGRTVIIITEGGSRAFVPLDKICEALKRFKLCVDDPRIKCEES